MLALNYVKKNLRAGGFAQAVLAYLADCMNEADGKCFPSRETIAEYFSSEDDPCTVKRVDRALARLRELGFIKSECVPHRKQPAKGIEGGWHNEYSFPGLSGAAPKTDATHRNGVDPIAGVSPTVESGSPHRGVEKQKETEVKQKRNSSSAHTCEEPPFDDDLFDEAIRVVETETASESPPEKKQKKPRKARTSFATVERPDDLPEQLWQDWLELRKAKRAPLNTTTINTFRAEAQKAGISFEEAVSFSVANGYQGFKADWYRKNASTFTNGRPHQGYAGFGARNTAEIDYTAGID
ncbi:helix-turn-helix domain-containing protein [Sutterella wadsworthensis]|uniref:helix-turn-helix domain-containing protein n=1 Tax=Sutterella wadsworthensis TaxID=40545 RepID=UPI0013F5CB46|nr:helix-turn-helix domain-containing protein [Sutterella wadsworthensis]